MEGELFTDVNQEIINALVKENEIKILYRYPIDVQTIYSIHIK